MTHLDTEHKPMPASNRMTRLVSKFDSLPGGLRTFVQSMLLGRKVPFVGTAKLRIEEVSQTRVVVSIRNRRRVQNHIKGVHAAAMALLAETATGFAIGMYVPDDKTLLLKSMKIEYVRRAQGDLRAVVELRPEQLDALLTDERGQLNVPVSVTDQGGNSPIHCDVIWAWIPRRGG